jgi:phosphoglycerate dehydrogenase-like enzyme
MTGTKSSPLRRVHILHPLEHEAQLRSQLARDVVLTIGDGRAGVPADVQVLVGGRPTAEALDGPDPLRVLLIPYAGLPPETRTLLLDRPQIAVHNLHHNAAAAAELALALFLAAAKQIVPADRDLRGGDWTIRYAEARELLLEGKTAVILGFGAVGRRIATACAGMGLRILGVRRHPDRDPADEAADEVHGVASLPALLPAAHALFVTVPLTPETRGMVDAAVLEALPQDAVLVNIARGPVVDEAALYHALSRGRIGAAGLDVWYRYPRTKDERRSTPPSSQPFHELDNVVLSPHRGGAYRHPELEQARMEHLAVSLNAAARGEPIPHPVDVLAGY